jgi:DNA-binding NarL/FixJ family response regulator
VSIRVLVADDQALIRAGFTALVEHAEDMVVVGQAADGRAAVELASATRPDVVLMDIRMPVLDGIAATRAISEDPALAGVRVLVLTTFDADEHVLAALRAGASGFLGKDVGPTELVAGIRVVARGDALLSPRATTALVQRLLAHPQDGLATGDPTLAVLTDREREIVAMVARGLSNDEIASALVLSPLTVKTHVNRAMTKTHARDRAQLVVLAYQSGLVRPG